jgi:hypothetical protein
MSLTGESVKEEELRARGQRAYMSEGSQVGASGKGKFEQDCVELQQFARRGGQPRGDEMKQLLEFGVAWEVAGWLHSS